MPVCSGNQEVMLLKQTYPGVPESVSAIRHDVVDAVRRAGGEERLLDAVALAVSEAATNAIIHAYGDGRSGAIHVRVSHTGSVLDVQVTDEGVGMRPQQCDRGGLGLGLSLIASVTDSVQIGHGPTGSGTRLRMRFAWADNAMGATV
jgi:anti-sigma regulatory factor (Ser/Thr protein kinase)